MFTRIEKAESRDINCYELADTKIDEVDGISRELYIECVMTELSIQKRLEGAGKVTKYDLWSHLAFPWNRATLFPTYRQEGQRGASSKGTNATDYYDKNIIPSRISK